ncbi:MAG: hypothetical protein DMF87_06425 [Acidobacteria bacterium]|nr:MAG: hypothetical protein DMF87_06425 [Acidobacteriota bacterium]
MTATTPEPNGSPNTSSAKLAVLRPLPDEIADESRRVLNVTPFRYGFHMPKAVSATLSQSPLPSISAVVGEPSSRCTTMVVFAGQRRPCEK